MRRSTFWDNSQNQEIMDFFYDNGIDLEEHGVYLQYDDRDNIAYESYQTKFLQILSQMGANILDYSLKLSPTKFASDSNMNFTQQIENYIVENTKHRYNTIVTLLSQTIQDLTFDAFNINTINNNNDISYDCTCNNQLQVPIEIFRIVVGYLVVCPMFDSRSQQCDMKFNWNTFEDDFLYKFGTKTTDLNSDCRNIADKPEIYFSPLVLLNLKHEDGQRQWKCPFARHYRDIKLNDECIRRLNNFDDEYYICSLIDPFDILYLDAIYQLYIINFFHLKTIVTSWQNSHFGCINSFCISHLPFVIIKKSRFEIEINVKQWVNNSLNAVNMQISNYNIKNLASKLYKNIAKYPCDQIVHEFQTDCYQHLYFDLVTSDNDSHLYHYQTSEAIENW